MARVRGLSFLSGNLHYKYFQPDPLKFLVEFFLLSELLQLKAYYYEYGYYGEKNWIKKVKLKLLE